MKTKKVCFKCNQKYELSQFYKHPKMRDGHVNKCKSCNRKDNRENWHLKIDEKRQYDFFRHRFSIERLFRHKYYMITTRCTKKRKDGGKVKSVYGKKFLSKSDWLGWCHKEENYTKFMSIYNAWVQNGFVRKMSPSIDRINNPLGYVKNNLQWMTLSENAKKSDK